jgi:hypothetical protein
VYCGAAFSLFFASWKVSAILYFAVEVLFLTVIRRWPFSDYLEHPQKIVDEERQVIYEQMSLQTLAEVGRFWSQSYPWREPCGRHLFKKFEFSEKNRIESELEQNFGDFFRSSASSGLGYFARNMTGEIVAFRLANDTAQAQWSIEEVSSFFFFFFFLSLICFV